MDAGIVSLYVIGIPYLLYLPFRWSGIRMLREEYDGKPWEFFHCLWGFSFLWALGYLVLSLPIVLIAYILAFLALPLFVATGPAGCLLLLYDLVKATSSKAQGPPPYEQRRFQFRMMDLLGFVAAYGICLLVLGAYQSASGRPESFLFLAATVSLVLEALAFGIGLNVLARVGEERPASSRLGFLTGWLVYATFFFPLALATWLAWRHALDRAEIPASAG